MNAVIVGSEDIDGMDLWDDYDYCNECRRYGNDYSFDDGELVDNCADCVFSPCGEESNDE